MDDSDIGKKLRSISRNDSSLRWEIKTPEHIFLAPYPVIIGRSGLIVYAPMQRAAVNTKDKAITLYFNFLFIIYL